MKDKLENNSKLKLKIGVVVLTTLFLSGCGKVASGENIDVGMQQLQARQYEEALESFEQAMENKEDSQMTLRGLGIASIGVTDYEGAIEYFKQALSYSDIRPDDMDIDMNYYLADAYTKMSQPDKAKDTYNAILALEPKEINALFLRGKIYLQTGDYESAVVDFNHALEYDKENYDLRIEVAGQLTEHGYKEEGEKYLTDFLAENEKKLSNYEKGRIYYYLGDYENARMCLENEKERSDQDAILILGKTYEKLGDFNYATSVYKNYLSEHEDAAVIYNQLGLCKLMAGEYSEALSAFQNAANIENNGMDKILSYNIIVANEYSGNFSQAKLLMEQYLKKYPEDAQALRENEFLKSR